MSVRNRELEQLARRQLFVLDLRDDDAAAAIAAQLGGGDAQSPLVWRDADSALLIYPGETRVRLAPGYVLVELRVATDQTGVDALVLPFRIGGSPNQAVATAVTETIPRGNAVLASRWGTTASTVVWHAILRAGAALLAHRKLAQPMTISGVYTLGRVLSFLATTPVDAAEVRAYFVDTLKSDVVPDLSVLNRRFLGSLPIKRSRKG